MIKNIHIKEVSIQTGITQYTIRYYEKENLLLIPRDKNGIRTFNDKTILRLETLKKLRMAGMSISEMRLIMSGEVTHHEQIELYKNRLEALIEQKKSIIDTIKFMEYKIKVHERQANNI